MARNVKSYCASACKIGADAAETVVYVMCTYAFVFFRELPYGYILRCLFVLVLLRRCLCMPFIQCQRNSHSTGTGQTRTVLYPRRHITPRFMQRIHFIAFLDRILHCIADAWRCQYHIHRGLSQRVLWVLDSELSLKLAELAAAALLAQSFELGCWQF